MENKEVNLKLSIEDANLILEALGNLPFKQVYGLIGKIQQQAAQQLQTGNGQAPEPEEELKIEQE